MICAPTFWSRQPGFIKRFALKKSTASGAEDLRISIEEGLTDAAAILELFPPDERVRYLDAPRLWSFLVEDEFWSTLNAEANRERGHRPHDLHARERPA